MIHRSHEHFATTGRGALQRHIATLLSLLLLPLVTACTDSTPTFEEASSPIPPGELCFDPAPDQVRLHFQPSFLVITPDDTRPIRLIVEPDFCSSASVELSSSSDGVVAMPEADTISYGKPAVTWDIAGIATGTTTLTASLTNTDGSFLTTSIDVEVLEPTALTCSSDDDVPSTALSAGSSVRGDASLSGASITLPEGADQANSGSFLWSVTPFDASIACVDDIVPSGYRSLGPAIQFGPEALRFKRDLPLSIPINPALMPKTARWRHLRIAYAGPGATEARTIPVTDPRIEKRDGIWQFSFQAPRLGRYQAVVDPLAGTKVRQRRITHRAVLGVSMGGAGTAQFGLRNHHLFDTIAPLGGPVDWTWLIDHLEKNHLGGFRPIASGTTLADIQIEKTTCLSDDDCAADETCLGWVAEASLEGRCTLMPNSDEPYAHPSTYNNWWYEYPRTGHGGSFPRDNYVQIFRDLALTFGNPNGYNPLAANLPAGVDPDHKSQTGDHPGDSCKIWLDPLDDHPDEENQKELANKCPAERCKYTQVLENYYDDEYNPDGTFPVITVCDGAPQNELLTPYANTWTPSGNSYPLEVGLAVDYNGNGVRDELEPIIRAGHEHWYDHGEDQTPSALEPGYGPERLDPHGDDYDPQYNPTGTEGDHRRQLSEAFDDYGLDGVEGTSDSPYDHGEGDQAFTVAPGLQRMWDYDPHSIVRRWTTQMPVEELDDEALSRIDLWTDGGTRDLFNFALTAQHLAGTFAARGRDVAYFSDFVKLPGMDPADDNSYDTSRLIYEDLQGIVMQRYGKNEPSQADLENGSGQHVGSVNEIARRLQSALFFIGSRWPDASRSLVEVAADNPAEGIPQCEIEGSCLFEFTGSSGRTGPIGVTLPPGYGHAEQQDRRYPVIYMLHGYGQTPEDLRAAIVFLANWMNSPTYSQATRLPKVILIYVDGRCRIGADGKPECIRGTFFTDSAREGGAQLETWWLELMDHVDQNYRTLGESVISWTD